MMGDSYTESTLYYPPLPFRPKPVWYNELPEFYRLILDEVYQALDNSLFFLASSATRTALDILVVEKIGDIGSFKDKIERLCSAGMIDSTEQDMLLAVIDAGSASTHRNYRPNDEAMNHMIDILEEIFHKMIIAPGRKQDLGLRQKHYGRQHLGGNPANPWLKTDVEDARLSASLTRHGLAA